jgi:predicted ester cyclase
MSTRAEVRDESARAALTAFYRAMSQRDIRLFRSVVTPDWQYIPPSSGAASGPDSMIPVFADLSSAIPDMDITILDVLVHGNKVAVRARVTGTHSGPLMGIAPTSRPIDFAIHSFHELRRDRIAKTWHLEDWLDVFRQVGELPSNLPRT